MSTLATIADVIDAFKQKSFEFVGKSDEGWFKLLGPLTPPGAKEEGYPCEVQLDPTFSDLPRIRLLDIPPELPKVVPHIGANGGLCYLAKGSVVLDIYDPVGQSLACLQRAADVLGQILKGEMIDDLTEEFFAYWNGWICFVDMQGEDLGRQNCIITQGNGKPSCFISDNEERTRAKLKSLGYRVADKTVLTYRVKTNAQPRPLTSHWPPKTVGDILAWQSTLDTRCRRKIHERIAFSAPNWTPIPRQTGHPVQRKLDTDSAPNWTV